MNPTVKYLIESVKTDPIWYPCNRITMITYLKQLIDEFIILSKVKDEINIPFVISTIQWLKKKEPKLFAQSRRYLGQKRVKLIRPILSAK